MCVFLLRRAWAIKIFSRSSNNHKTAGFSQNIIVYIEHLNIGIKKKCNKRNKNSLIYNTFLPFKVILFFKYFTHTVVQYINGMMLPFFN